MNRLIAPISPGNMPDDQARILDVVTISPEIWLSTASPQRTIFLLARP
jgi:hypothetical protein